MFSSSDETRLRPYLLADEKLVWIGKPAQGLRLGPRDVFLIPFSVLWVGFVILWETIVAFSAVKGETAAWFGLLWGGIFLVVGLFIAVGRFFVDAWIRSRVIYALTDRRALVLRQVFSEQLLSTRLDSELRLKQSKNGKGDIEFGSQSLMAPFLNGAGFSIWIPALDGSVSFRGVQNVAEVYRLAQQGAR